MDKKLKAVRIEPELEKQILDMAEKEDRSFSSMIRMMAKFYIESKLNN